MIKALKVLNLKYVDSTPMAVILCSKDSVLRDWRTALIKIELREQEDIHMEEQHISYNGDW